MSRARPASVDKIVTLFMDRSSPNLEHSFPVSYRSKIVVCSSIGSSMCACAITSGPSLTAVKFLHQRLALFSRHEVASVWIISTIWLCIYIFFICLGTACAIILHVHTYISFF